MIPLAVIYCFKLFSLQKNFSLGFVFISLLWHNETCIPHMIGKNKWQRKFLFPHKDEHQLTVVCFKNLLMCDSKFNKQKCKWDDKKNVLVLTSTRPSFNWFGKKLLIQSKWGSQTKHYFKVLLYFCKHIFIRKNVPIICMQLYTERDIYLKWNYFNA